MAFSDQVSCTEMRVNSGPPQAPHYFKGTGLAMRPTDCNLFLRLKCVSGSFLFQMCELLVIQAAELERAKRLMFGLWPALVSQTLQSTRGLLTGPMGTLGLNRARLSASPGLRAPKSLGIQQPGEVS